MKELIYLIAAYTSIWIVLATYIWVLLKRNRGLTSQVDELEARLGELEKRAGDTGG